MTPGPRRRKGVSFIFEQETSPTLAVVWRSRTRLERTCCYTRANDRHWCSGLRGDCLESGRKLQTGSQLFIRPWRSVAPYPCELFDTSRYRVQPPTSWVDAATLYSW